MQRLDAPMPADPVAEVGRVGLCSGEAGTAISSSTKRAVSPTGRQRSRRCMSTFPLAIKGWGGGDGFEPAAPPCE
jgi:hypothetical protein